MKKVTFNLDADFHHKLKIEAAKRGTTMTELVEEALRLFVVEPLHAAFPELKK